MAAGGDHAVRPDPFGFARFLPIAAQQKEMEIVRPDSSCHDLSQHHRERLRYFPAFSIGEPVGAAPLHFDRDAGALDQGANHC